MQHEVPTKSHWKRKPSPASQQETHPASQTLILELSTWDPEIQSITTISDTEDLIIHRESGTTIRTFTPGAKAPRNTACADDISSPSDFLLAIFRCRFGSGIWRQKTIWGLCEFWNAELRVN